MFDRLLGPKTDHADPRVRAKAFGQESVDTAALNNALKSERDADVLCVILGRATDVSAVLDHAQSGDGSIANEARARLVALAESGENGTADEWSHVYAAARKGGWTQQQALNDVLRPVAGREPVVQGALEVLSDSHDVPERVLFTLATQSGSAFVRRLAARNLHSRDVLEEASNELKDKDKTVYRELRDRIDVFRRDDECRALATKLSEDCTALTSVVILAQPESVAVAQARMQTLEQRVNGLNEQSPDIGAKLVSRFADVRQVFDTNLQAARTLVEKRKELKSELATLIRKMGGGSADQSLDVTANLDAISSAWHQVPDHGDLEEAEFDKEMKGARALAQQHLSDQDVLTRLNAKLDRWEAQAESVPPAKLLQTIRRDWDSTEKPRVEEQLADVQQRVDGLLGKLGQLEQKLEQKRASNSQQLLAILDDFKVTMEKGEFKKAMSLNDKLKARASTRELEPAARKRIDDALKAAQPKLEEFRKWRHFGTQQARETLIGQANTLASNPPASPKALATSVKELREAWRKLDQDDGRASETQWQTFSKACKEAYKPAKKHFDQLAKDRKKNLGVRKTILEELEKLVSETDWDAPDWASVTTMHKELMAQWRRSGTVDYKFKKELDASFESVNSRVDEQFRDERESELLRRRRLIDNLKSLAETESGGKLAGAAKRAQREWKPTVQGDRKTEQALWEEFRGVCDEIFGALKQQQKENKAAWQADATEREELCAQLDALLEDTAGASEDYDRRAANQATGRVKELASRWRQRHQIPPAVMSKLDARFKLAKKQAEKRISAVVRRDEKLAMARLDTLLDACQRAEEELLSGQFDMNAYEAMAGEFDALKGAAGKALQKRYQQVIKGMGGDSAVPDMIAEAHSANRTLREELCLLGELVAEVDSPPHADKERMALRMKRLTEAMQGDLPAPEKELEDIIERWYSTGGVSAGEWAPLSKRFAPVRAAQGQLQ